MVSSADEVLDAIREQRRAYEPFTPLTDDEVKRAVQAIQDTLGEWGSDRLHAQWARLVLDNTERNVRAVAAGAGDRPTLCQHTNWLPPVHAGDPEVCENCGLERGAGDRPPAPSDAAQKLADAIIDEFGAVGLGPDHEDYTHEDYLIGLALEVRAVRPPPRAVLTVETLADWIWDAAARTSGSHVTISRTGCEVLATRLLPRLGAASPAAAPREEGA